jgi:hypothetical protein
MIRRRRNCVRCGRELRRAFLRRLLLRLLGGLL